MNLKADVIDPRAISEIAALKTLVSAAESRCTTPQENISINDGIIARFEKLISLYDSGDDVTRQYINHEISTSYGKVFGPTKNLQLDIEKALKGKEGGLEKIATLTAIFVSIPGDDESEGYSLSSKSP